MGLADSVVLPANPDRNRLLISNPGPNPIWIAFGRPAVANKSVLVPTNSAPILFTDDDWPGLIQQDIHAVTVNAAGTLAGLAGIAKV